jgi:hypothetical protein
MGQLQTGNDSPQRHKGHKREKRKAQGVGYFFLICSLCLCGEFLYDRVKRILSASWSGGSSKAADFSLKHERPLFPHS